MSVSVRKYPLQLKAKQVIKLEADAVILPGVYSRWGEPALYVIGNHKPLNTKTTIRMIGTSDNFKFNPETMKYIGNFINAIDCWHFFKVTDED